MLRDLEAGPAGGGRADRRRPPAGACAQGPDPRKRCCCRGPPAACRPSPGIARRVSLSPRRPSALPGPGALLLGPGPGAARGCPAQLQARGVQVAGPVPVLRQRRPPLAPASVPVAGRYPRPAPGLPELARARAASSCSVPPAAEGAPRRCACCCRRFTPSPPAPCAGSAICPPTSCLPTVPGGWLDASPRGGRHLKPVGGSAGSRSPVACRWPSNAALPSRYCARPALRPGRNALLQLAAGAVHRHVVRPGLVFTRLHVQDLAAVIIAAMQRPVAQGMSPPPATAAPAAGRCCPSPRSLGDLRCHPPVDWMTPALSPALRRFYQSSPAPSPVAARGRAGVAAAIPQLP